MLILYVCMHLFLAVLGLWCCSGFSLVVASGDYSLVAVCMDFSLWWLLLLWSSGFRGAGFRTCVMWAQESWLPGSRAQAQWLWRTGCYSEACGIFPDQASNPRLLHWQADSLPLSHEGHPLFPFKIPVQAGKYKMNILIKCLYPVWSKF